MTLSIVAVLNLNEQGVVLLAIGYPGSSHHPYRVGWTFSTNLEEYWASGLVEGVVYKKSLHTEKISTSVLN